MSGGWTGSTRSSRLPKDWPKRRAKVLKRDKGICYICHRPGADQVDHVKAGDDHSLHNLRAIHSEPCHKHKTAREGALARHKHKKERKTPKHPGLA